MNRINLKCRKIQSKVDYISLTMGEGVHFEENLMSRKRRIFVLTSNDVAGFVHFSTTATGFNNEELFTFLHPCMGQQRFLKDMAIDFQRFMSRGDVPRRQRLLFYMLNNVPQKQTTCLYVLQSVKFDGEQLGIPITHLYATRKFHPGNVARADKTVKVYARFDFVEAMYVSDDIGEMVPGTCAMLHSSLNNVT